MSDERPVLIVVGTRPEGIKMIPVYFALKEAQVDVMLCSTDQHTNMLQDVFDVFKVSPDIRLSIGKAGQDLFHVNELVLRECKKLYTDIRPSLVLVEGDTTTVMASALAAFYLKISIGHVEAGLRTHDICQPFPEEVNRRIVSLIAKYHFTPTALPSGNLMAERTDPASIYCVGNTVVDSLRIMKEKIADNKIAIHSDIKKVVQKAKANGKKIVLVTAHRRESFNGGIYRILKSIKWIANTHDNLFFIYPVHPNPVVLKSVKAAGLRSVSSIFLTESLSYADLVYVLLESYFVMTDSGGIQEEAVSLNKPVVVLREKTERVEGVWEGLAFITGTNQEKILSAVQAILHNLESSKQFKGNSIYGDGFAAQKIARIVVHDHLNENINKIPEFSHAESSVLREKQ